MTSLPPAPHRVVIRVKRQRVETPIDSLLVAPAPVKHIDIGGSSTSRKRAADASFAEAFVTLSMEDTVLAQSERKCPVANFDNINGQHLRYKRFRTTGVDGTSSVGASILCSMAPCSEPIIPVTGLEETRYETGPRNGTVQAMGERICGEHLDFLEVRRLKAKGVSTRAAKVDTVGAMTGLSEQGNATNGKPASVSTEFHVIDLVGYRGSDERRCLGDIQAEENRCLEGQDKKPQQQRRPAPVLNPMERLVDEAIFMAFQAKENTQALLSAVSSHVNYRRCLGDGTTALMAAAFQGNLTIVKQLLDLHASPGMLDANGRGAADFALGRGHLECAAAIHKAAAEEGDGPNKGLKDAGGGGEKGGAGGGFVYDLYCFQPGVTNTDVLGGGLGVLGTEGTSTATGAPTVGKSGGTPQGRETSMSGVPLIHLSGIGPVSTGVEGLTEGGVGVAEEMELVFEHESDWSDLGKGDRDDTSDSNDEGFYANDYPEEDSDEYNNLDLGRRSVGSDRSDNGSNTSSSSDDGNFYSSGDEIDARTGRMHMPMTGNGCSTAGVKGWYQMEGGVDAKGFGGDGWRGWGPDGRWKGFTNRSGAAALDFGDNGVSSGVPIGSGGISSISSFGEGGGGQLRSMGVDPGVGVTGRMSAGDYFVAPGSFGSDGNGEGDVSSNDGESDDMGSMDL